MKTVSSDITHVARESLTTRATNYTRSCALPVSKAYLSYILKVRDCVTQTRKLQCYWRFVKSRRGPSAVAKSNQISCICQKSTCRSNKGICKRNEHKNCRLNKTKQSTIAGDTLR